MASELTPTVITDKNGRITTVHRKNAKVGKAKAMPAPRRDFTNEAMAAMSAMGANATYSESAASNLAYLAEHDPKLLSGIIEQCATDDMAQKTWHVTIQYRKMFSSDDPEADRENLVFCRGMLELYPVASRISKADKQYIPGVIKLMVEDTLEYTQRYSGGDWGTVRLAMIAKRFVTEEDQHGVIFTMWRRLPEMIELIPELAQRGKVDGETLEILLDSETSALREGEL